MLEEGALFETSTEGVDTGEASLKATLGDRGDIELITRSLNVATDLVGLVAGSDAFTVASWADNSAVAGGKRNQSGGGGGGGGRVGTSGGSSDRSGHGRASVIPASWDRGSGGRSAAAHGRRTVRESGTGGVTAGWNRGSGGRNAVAHAGDTMREDRVRAAAAGGARGSGGRGGQAGGGWERQAGNHVLDLAENISSESGWNEAKLGTPALAGTGDLLPQNTLEVLDDKLGTNALLELRALSETATEVGHEATLGDGNVKDSTNGGGVATDLVGLVSDSDAITVASWADNSAVAGSKRSGGGSTSSGRGGGGTGRGASRRASSRSSAWGGGNGHGSGLSSRDDLRNSDGLGDGSVDWSGGRSVEDLGDVKGLHDVDRVDTVSWGDHGGVDDLRNQRSGAGSHGLNSGHGGVNSEGGRSILDGGGHSRLVADGVNSVNTVGGGGDVGREALGGGGLVGVRRVSASLVIAHTVAALALSNLDWLELSAIGLRLSAWRTAAGVAIDSVWAKLVEWHNVSKLGHLSDDDHLWLRAGAVVGGSIVEVHRGEACARGGSQGPSAGGGGGRERVRDRDWLVGAGNAGGGEVAVGSVDRDHSVDVVIGRAGRSGLAVGGCAGHNAA